jgi:hypothetical protein
MVTEGQTDIINSMKIRPDMTYQLLTTYLLELPFLILYYL